MKNSEKIPGTNSYLWLDENGKFTPLERGDFYAIDKKGLIVMPMLVHSDDYVEREFSKLALQLKTFAEKTPGAYALKYGLSTGFLAEALKDADYVNFFLGRYGEVSFYAKSWTTHKDELLMGTGTLMVAFPAPIDLTGAPLAVAPGVTARFREKALFIKSQKSKYLVSEGQIMYIEKVNHVFDPAAGKPALTVHLVGGGHPHLDYTKSEYSGLEIQKDSNDGHGFVFADKTTNPSWVDNSALPAANTSAIWKYQGIYLLNNAHVGDWSDPVAIPVKGV